MVGDTLNRLIMVSWWVQWFIFLLMEIDGMMMMMMEIDGN
jgi:hypothetical protein